MTPGMQNRYYDHFIDGQSSLKVRFSFDNPNLLDDFPFLGKIGMNLDPSLKEKFIGFAFFIDKVRISQYYKNGQKSFLTPKLLLGLDHDGVLKEDSQVIKLTD